MSSGGQDCNDVDGLRHCRPSVSANEIAKALGVPTNRLTEIIRSKRGSSGDTALRLGRWFGTGPDIWMNLQKNYELRVAVQAIGDALQKIPEPIDNFLKYRLYNLGQAQK